MSGGKLKQQEQASWGRARGWTAEDLVMISGQPRSASRRETGGPIDYGSVASEPARLSALSTAVSPPGPAMDGPNDTNVAGARAPDCDPRRSNQILQDWR